MAITVGFAIAFLLVLTIFVKAETAKVKVMVEGEKFLNDGKPTYSDVLYVNPRAIGMLINTCMVQALFDDENPETFGATPMGANLTLSETLTSLLLLYKAHSVIAFTINLQCGSPKTGQFIGNQLWHMISFNADGSLKLAWLNRLKRILDAAQKHQEVHL